MNTYWGDYNILLGLLSPLTVFYDPSLFFTHQRSLIDLGFGLLELILLEHLGWVLSIENPSILLLNCKHEGLDHLLNGEHWVQYFSKFLSSQSFLNGCVIES